MIGTIFTECQYQRHERGFVGSLLYASFNLRFESLRFVRGQFSATQRQICLPRAKSWRKKESRMVTAKNLSAGLNANKGLACRMPAPLNGEIIIVPIFI